MSEQNYGRYEHVDYISIRTSQKKMLKGYSSFMPARVIRNIAYHQGHLRDLQAKNTQLWHRHCCYEPQHMLP